MPDSSPTQKPAYQALHQPVVAPGVIEGTWLVYCDACSDESNNYVPRCKLADEPGREKWPPRTLHEDEPPVSQSPVLQGPEKPAAKLSCLACEQPAGPDSACDRCRPMMEADAKESP